MRDYAELIKDLRESAEWSDRLAVLMGRDVGDSKAPLMRKAADAIEELLAKDTNVPNKWISVEERLPEDGKYVLCWYEYYHWSKEKMLPEYGIGYCINGHWGGEVSNGRDCKVLYWMPLPEPPKED